MAPPSMMLCMVLTLHIPNKRIVAHIATFLSWKERGIHPMFMGTSPKALSHTEKSGRKSKEPDRLHQCQYKIWEYYNAGECISRS